MQQLSLSYRPFTLELKHQFTVSSFSRSTTPVVLTTINYDGIKGYGEASMPPYLGESHDSVLKFLSRINLSQFSDPLAIDEILDYVDAIDDGNNAAKASVDIALHDLIGKLACKPLHQLWNLNPENAPQSSFTIGIDKPEVMVSRLKEAKGFEIIKLKLGTEYDKDIITSVRNATDLPLMVDVNQGWTNKDEALEMAHWLKEKGVLILEQPLPKERLDDLAWLSERSPIPIIGDEGIRRLSDFERNKGVYNGVNVKLMKSAGLREARKILDQALKNNLITMIGCMTETSCGVAAAAQLSPLCRYADLDGPFLISNNPFEELQLKNGCVKIPTKPGIGIDVKHTAAQ